MKHREGKTKEQGLDLLLAFDILLLGALALAFATDFAFGFYGINLENILILVSLAGLLPVLMSALRALWRRRLTIDLLASVALIFSLANREWHSAVFISLMLVCARLFARFTDKQARKAIESLLKLRPAKAHVKSGDKVKEVPIEEIKVGDLLQVSDGERVPVDGVVVEGRGALDQSSLTGESLPQNKRVGEQVFESTLTIEGNFVMKATKVGEDTTFSKIVDLVEKSQQGKAPITSLTDKFSSWYIFLIILGSLAIYFFSHNSKLLLSVLLVTCADDVAVAIPLAFTAAIGAAARWGVIIKGSRFLEGLTKVKTLVADKTGTITQGRLEIKNSAVFAGASENEFLSLLGGVVIESSHPTAKAILGFLKKKKIEPAKIDGIYEESGYGIKGYFGGEQLYAGRPGFLKKYQISFSSEENSAFEKEENLGRSVIVLSKSKKAIGFISLADSVRHNSQRVIKELKVRGVKDIFMITGDNEKVAENVAAEVGISEFRANFLPDDKLEFLRKLLNKKTKVMMLGDGVNDAPALVLADIGCAMGAIGTEAAIESADIVLMKDDLESLPHLFDLADYTLKVIRQDIFIWGASNFVGLLLVFLGVLGPLGAAAFNFLTDFLPLINSLKLFRLHQHGRISKK
jgi:heavy metal translocating P-type ATPase